MFCREPCAWKLARTVLTGAGERHSLAVRSPSTHFTDVNGRRPICQILSGLESFLV